MEALSDCRIGAAAPISQTLALLSFAAMPSVPPEFVTVDMRGLKTVLIERSRSERVSVSSLVRTLVASGLQQTGEGVLLERSSDLPRAPKSKLSIRVSPAEARQFVDGARQAGISQAAHLSELLAGAPSGVTRATRSEQLAALAATNAELSTLNRNLRHLATLLGQGSVRAAQEYRGMLVTIAGDVRRHLTLASALMAEMRSRRLPPAGAEQTSPTFSRGNHV